MNGYPAASREADPSPLQRFLQQSPDVWFEYDESLRYSIVNPAGLTLLGINASDILGKTNAELAHTFPFLKDVFEGMHACLFQVAQTGEPCSVMHEFITGSQYQCYEMIYTPILENGTLLRIFSVGRNVTPYQHLISLRKNRPIIGVEMPGLPSTVALTSPANREDGKHNSLSSKEISSDSPLPDQNKGNSLLHEASSQPQVSYPPVDKIQQNAEFLQLVLDNIPQYIFWKDCNSVYLGCNRRWAEMAGIGDPEQVVGMTDHDFSWTEEEIHWYRECDRRVIETDTPLLRIKESQLQADGKQTWREVNKLPIHDANGAVIGLLGTIEDITERILAEDLLKQSEAKFKQLAQREEVLNHLTSQIRRSLNLKTILETVVREVRQLLQTDRVLVYQFDPHWQGTVVVEDVIEPWEVTLGDRGADQCFPSEYAALYRDGRVRTIDNIADADLEPCYYQFLQQLQVKANLAVPINMQSELWGLLVVHSCAAPRHWEDWEVSLLKQLGDQVAIAIQQAELYTQAKENALQAKVQAEQLQQTLLELQHTQAQLIQTEKMSGLGQLVAGIAHEINNPINFIYGNLVHIETYTQDLIRLVSLYETHYPNPVEAIANEIQTLDLDFLLEDLRKIVKSVQVGTERIRQIVLSLRNFSRLDEAEMKPVDIHEGLDSTLLILQHRLKAQGDHPEIRILKDYGEIPQVECYAGQLNQVFMNILANAIDALRSKGGDRQKLETTADLPVITLSTRIVPNRSTVQIHIRDNGSGMTAAVQARLFDPFFTTKPVGQGTGLGLSISHQIVVDKHKGSLTCQSAVGQGTEFMIEIPIRPKRF